MERTTILDNSINAEMKICSYNINGLFNKIQFPYFFEFLESFDIFCCLETHIFDLNKKEQLKLYFPDFNLHWKLAERRSTRGRGISGILVGWKKDLMKRLNVEINVIQCEKITIINVSKGDESLRIVPFYIRSEDFEEELSTFRRFL